ncbi:hypothetical protein ACWGKU_24395, partial [Kitasatospora sp. NPDC054768]
MIAAGTGTGPPGRTAGHPVVTGVGVLSAAGRGLAPLAEAATHGKSLFGPVTRFDVSSRRTTRAALFPATVPLACTFPLARAVLDAIGQACGQAGMTAAEGAGLPVLLALHSDE